MLDPPISAIEAKRGIEILLRLGLIKKQNGSYVQTDTVITTGDEVQNIAVANFQRETSDLSRRAITRLGNKQEISTLTFGTNKTGFKEIQSEIRAFRKKLITIIAKPKAS